LVSSATATTPSALRSRERPTATATRVRPRRCHHRGRMFLGSFFDPGMTGSERGRTGGPAQSTSDAGRSRTPPMPNRGRRLGKRSGGDLRCSPDRADAVEADHRCRRLAGQSAGGALQRGLDVDAVELG
jgi:hypothetical protein